MSFYGILNFAELSLIATLSGLIAYEFYMSIDGRLRVLMFRLFISKIWVYGGAAVLYIIFKPEDFIKIRIFLVAPMVIIMVQLWGYIRGRRKK